jgi:perosamine synthetase
MTLAINGGEPVRRRPWQRQICLNEDDRNAVNRVLDSGFLSGYRANSAGQYGGFEIKALVKEWCEKFEVEYAIPCNSATSGIMICLLSSGVRHASVSVSPYSMTCSASLPLLYGVDPTFSDIDEDYFQLENSDCNISIPVSLFGHPLSEIYAEDYVIEDSAQCVSKQIYETEYRVHSFTTGKHISAGEGGMITTNKKDLYRIANRVMNHWESVAHEQGATGSGVGMNLRMTEIQAALVRSQLRRLDENVRIRQENAAFLNEGLQQIPGIRPAKTNEEGVHSYYCAPFHYERSSVHRDQFIAAVKAELSNIRVNTGYIKPLYRFPCFSAEKNALRLPVVEQMWKNELFLMMDIAHPHTTEDMKDVVTAFHKVAENERDIPGTDQIP